MGEKRDFIRKIAGNTYAMTNQISSPGRIASIDIFRALTRLFEKMKITLKI